MPRVTADTRRLCVGVIPPPTDTALLGLNLLVTAPLQTLQKLVTRLESLHPEPFLETYRTDHAGTTDQAHLVIETAESVESLQMLQARLASENLLDGAQVEYAIRQSLLAAHVPPYKPYMSGHVEAKILESSETFAEFIDDPSEVKDSGLHFVSEFPPGFAVKRRSNLRYEPNLARMTDHNTEILQVSYYRARKNAQSHFHVLPCLGFENNELSLRVFRDAGSVEIIIHKAHGTDRYTLETGHSIVMATSENKPGFFQVVPRPPRKTLVLVMERRIKRSEAFCALAFLGSSSIQRFEAKVPRSKPACLPQVMDLSAPDRLEKEHVRDVYDRIARHFGNTRYKGWPQIERFLAESISPGSVVVDIGCGNGKYSAAVGCHSVWIGTDFSFGQVDFARKQSLPEAASKLHFWEVSKSAHRPIEVVRDDCLSVNLRSGVADIVLCIAVLHHISTSTRRVHAIEELLRVSKDLVLIYVWSRQQSKQSVGAREFETADVFVPWTLQAPEKDQPTQQQVHRYYHVFQLSEIVAECEKACSRFGSARVQTCWYDANNWGIVLAKGQ
eukprot:Protomagalhaensia_sp_Gyna_25__418@NODE_1199_length_2073_cov_13_471485_g954_i0_p1_GENE_NODE_1199_length_2073_cov_13_471485_g954_i0NODE_1199_length_2073_cov_13_471485_g954_i0_p1_ORF_typecomplete_len558_score76_93Methyltransf_11/PF08241_12/8_3e11Methyltransf_25/PF13649_6/9_1e10Methyltransf_31/PF13847_6/7_4e10Methyltransf_23/PF13489_6/3_3e09MetW/PF07021_12/4_2e05Ubie_methyltran/PF01209_18/3_8e06Methyltransf_9/PF08003_11/3_1e05Methyltransf_12/PF08242_12/2_8e05DOT1/PF08123_13/5_5e05Pox_MCEL/PF03291_16